ncbi:hypothetical protein AB0I30_12940 [Nocardia tengchongensis]|uniref:hypothetical protein n=1 Tax=Nocardia tengchongensis TaxID=2055889 RepID=UPI0033DCF822
MIDLIALVAGILIGAIGMAVLNRLASEAGGHLPRMLPRRRPEDTAASRDLRENAGGSRHIRTHPSWRDRLEQPRQESPQ